LEGGSICSKEIIPVFLGLKVAIMGLYSTALAEILYRLLTWFHTARGMDQLGLLGLLAGWDG
jgi:hypothetical protein